MGVMVALHQYTARFKKERERFMKRLKKFMIFIAVVGLVGVLAAYFRYELVRGPNGGFIWMYDRFTGQVYTCEPDRWDSYSKKWKGGCETVTNHQ
jgi:hypothetical protein